MGGGYDIEFMVVDFNLCKRDSSSLIITLDSHYLHLFIGFVHVFMSM